MAILPRATLRVVIGMLLAAGARPDVRTCYCDLTTPEKMSTRECGLCREAENRPGNPEVFFLKDNNPRKPNRWLALPRYHLKGSHALWEMSREQRAALWNAAIAKARELWGEEWGLAINGDLSRTQCHTHIHIGKLLKGVETSSYVVVSTPAEIPAMEDGDGLWIHPDGNRLHVHLGEQITETVLLR
jgi:CDP-diacylglycerol pyrophosphatase